MSLCVSDSAIIRLVIDEQVAYSHRLYDDGTVGLYMEGASSKLVVFRFSSDTALSALLQGLGQMVRAQHEGDGK